MSERFRGQPRLRMDESSGHSKCIVCNLCALACPEQLIVIKGDRDPVTKRKFPVTWTYDLSRCMFCGLCAEACSTDALELTPDLRDGALHPRRHGAGPEGAGRRAEAGEVREVALKGHGFSRAGARKRDWGFGPEKMHDTEQMRVTAAAEAAPTGIFDGTAEAVPFQGRLLTANCWFL